MQIIFGTEIFGIHIHMNFSDKLEKKQRICLKQRNNCIGIKQIKSLNGKYSSKQQPFKRHFKNVSRPLTSLETVTKCCKKHHFKFFLKI